MKILHVITSLKTGGAEHLMVDLLPRLRDLGHEVELCVFNDKRTPFYQQLESSGIKIHGFSNRSDYYNINNIYRLRILMKNFDIIHTHNTAPQIFAAIGKPHGVNIVTTEHSTSTRRRNYKPLLLLDKWMYHRYNQIICISKTSEKSLQNYIGVNLNILTIENGVDLSKSENAKIIDLGIGDNVAITMVAGFRYEKDQPTLIKSLQFLPDKYHVVLVGDGEKRNELEALILDLKLQNRVHLFGLRTDVLSILKSSNIIVMSSHREGLSLSNIEGMASGNPFIASDVDGLREVTEGSGVLFPHGDSKTLASIIIKLTTDESFQNAVVEKCKEKARMYDISKTVMRYNDVYQSLEKNYLER